MSHLCMSQTLMESLGCYNRVEESKKAWQQKKLISQKDPNLGGTRVMDLHI